MEYFVNTFLDCDGETDIKTYFAYKVTKGRYFEAIQEEKRNAGERAFTITYKGKWKRIPEKAYINALETYYNA